jgi:hypothetical protein
MSAGANGDWRLADTLFGGPLAPSLFARQRSKLHQAGDIVNLPGRWLEWSRIQDRTHVDDAIDSTTGNGRSIVTADRPGTVHPSPAVDVRYLAGSELQISLLPAFH